jgi:hypothetical protein
MEKSFLPTIVIWDMGNGMRKILWMIFLFGAYIWTVTSGNDQAMLEKGKFLYKALVAWFDDADLDFQVKKEKARKKSRRWY